MANVLKEKVEVKRTGRKPIHPYGEWFDQAQAAAKNGGALELVAGKDFNCKVGTIRHSLYREGSKRGLLAKTAVKGENIVINDVVKKSAKKASK